MSDSPIELAEDAPPHQWTGRFFLPGPTEVRDAVLRAQTRPMIGHRGAGFEALMAGMEPTLRAVFRTERPVYVAACSATRMMEAAIRNGARARVLSLVNGAFSARFLHIARACGLHAEALEVNAGEAHSPEQVRDGLARAQRAGSPFDAVTVVHSETSTGVLNPLAEIARAVHESGDVALLVDGVTSVAGAPVETDAWQLDVILTGSQKALALPPGLALAVAQPHVLARATASTSRGTYFDFVEFENFALKHQTPSTPAVSLLHALAEQLIWIEREGIEARWARHAAMATRTAAWVDAQRERGIELSMLAPDGFRSPTVSCITVPATTTGTAINAEMKKRGYVISAGYGTLKDRTIRIGHMGDHTLEELDAVLDELERALSDLSPLR